MDKMQDSRSLHENNGRISQSSEINHEIQSPTRTDKQRISSRFDPTVSLKVKHRHQRTFSYEPAASARESWWRVTMKDSPIPGTYDTHLNTFIKEIVARPMTYGFKSDGRRRDPQPLEPKGKDLLPGAYTVEDFIERMHGLRLSYGFKGPERKEILKKSMAANQDKDIDVAPGLYETQKYQTINVPLEAASHSAFKSKVRRKIFLPKLGPAPGDYEPQQNVINVNTPTITSSFRSRIDRFPKILSNVPGPGTYDKLTAAPTLKQINTLSTRGTFYNANFARTTSAAV